MARSALVFLIFDAAVALLVPVALVLRRWVNDGLGLRALVELVAFSSVVLLGLAYARRRGELDADE